MMKFILLMGLVICLTNGGYGTFCYVCSNDKDITCTEYLGAMKTKVGDCNDTDKCLTDIFKFSSGSFIRRACANMTNPIGCNHTTIPKLNGTRVTCVCAGDYCNNSSTNPLSFLTMILYVLSNWL